MKLLFESTKRFEKDIHSLPKQDSRRVVAALNRYGAFVCSNPSTPYPNIYRTIIPRLKGGLDATLYSLRVDRDIRAILTVDDDPLFSQVIITLLRVVRHGELERAYKGIPESLYQGMLEKPSDGEKPNG